MALPSTGQLKANFAANMSGMGWLIGPDGKPVTATELAEQLAEQHEADTDEAAE